MKRIMALYNHAFVPDLSIQISRRFFDNASHGNSLEFVTAMVTQTHLRNSFVDIDSKLET